MQRRTRARRCAVHSPPSRQRSRVAPVRTRLGHDDDVPGGDGVAVAARGGHSLPAALEGAALNVVSDWPHLVAHPVDVRLVLDCTHACSVRCERSCSPGSWSECRQFAACIRLDLHARRRGRRSAHANRDTPELNRPPLASNSCVSWEWAVRVQFVLPRGALRATGARRTLLAAVRMRRPRFHSRHRRMRRGAVTAAGIVLVGAGK